MSAERRLFSDVASLLGIWDDMSDAERDRMPEGVWDAIIDLRRILDGASPNDGSRT